MENGEEKVDLMVVEGHGTPESRRKITYKWVIVFLLCIVYLIGEDSGLADQVPETGVQ